MLVRFKIQVWDADEKKIVTRKGITSGTSLGDAVDKLVSVEFDGEEVSEVSVYECFDTLYDFDLEEMIQESPNV